MPLTKQQQWERYTDEELKKFPQLYLEKIISEAMAKVLEEEEKE